MHKLSSPKAPVLCELQVRAIENDDLVQSESISTDIDRMKTIQYQKDLSLKQDMILDGNVEWSGNIFLNSHTLTVHGDLKHISGEMNIGEGKLIVDGNYHVYDAGYLKMTTFSTVAVSGDFIMQSRFGSNNVTSGTNPKNYLGGGTITVGGNL